MNILRKFTCLGWWLILIPIYSIGQDFSSLEKASATRVQVYFSKGQEDRALQIHDKVEKAYVYFQHLLQFSPSVTLLVLSQKDWPLFTPFPVYGMPHYDDDGTLIVAAEDNPFWNSFVPDMSTLPDDLAEKIQNVYRLENGNISMRPFFDLLAIHELGHAFHLQGGVDFQRTWLSEWWVNIMLHHFVAEESPDCLPALTLFPKMVVAKGSDDLMYTRLKDVHDLYDEIGRNHPQNYGWYQCRWHASAADMHDREGHGLGQTMWNSFKGQSQKLSDEELLKFIDERVNKTLYAYIVGWDEDVIRK